jgi:RNA polymerase sigma-70 factor (ECF subfamily)
MAWPLLQMIPAEAVASSQPYWALTAHLLKRMGQTTQSADAYRRAVGLSEDSALRAFLTAQMPPTASDQNAL